MVSLFGQPSIVSASPSNSSLAARAAWNAAPLATRVPRLPPSPVSEETPAVGVESSNFNLVGIAAKLFGNSLPERRVSAGALFEKRRMNHDRAVGPELDLQ